MSMYDIYRGQNICGVVSETYAARQAKKEARDLEEHFRIVEQHHPKFISVGYPPTIANPSMKCKQVVMSFK